MVAETHRQNEGLCFECFFPALTTTEELDRAEYLARVEAGLTDTPPEYLDFLQTHDGHQRYTHRSIRGKAWRLASCVPSHHCNLFESINVDGNAGEFHEILRLYSIGLAEVAKKGDPRLDQSIHKFGIERLASGFAIGEENADVLFVDPSRGHSIWCFHHDGEVEQLSDSFQSWLKQAKPYYKPIKKTAKSLQAQIPNYVGHWVPTSQPRTPVAHIPTPEYVFCDDSRARCIYPETEVSGRSESFGVWRLYGKDKLGFQESDAEWRFIRLPDGSIRSDDNPDFDITYGLKPPAGT